MTCEEVFGILGTPNDMRGGAWSGGDHWGDFRKTGDQMSKLHPFCRTWWNRTTYAIEVNWEGGRAIGARLWYPIPQDDGIWSKVRQWIRDHIGLQ
jgi:hypothetical protein